MTARSDTGSKRLAAASPGAGGIGAQAERANSSPAIDRRCHINTSLDSVITRNSGKTLDRCLCRVNMRAPHTIPAACCSQVMSVYKLLILLYLFFRPQGPRGASQASRLSVPIDSLNDFAGHRAGEHHVAPEL